MTTQHYSGSCQCGAVAFEADLDLDRTITCNCSRCQRMGFVLAFTGADSFTLKTGKDNLTEFRFNNHAIQHLFCKTCGVQGFGLGKSPDGTQSVAVNVNCLSGVNPRELHSKHVDGRSF